MNLLLFNFHKVSTTFFFLFFSVWVSLCTTMLGGSEMKMMIKEKHMRHLYKLAEHSRKKKYTLKPESQKKCKASGVSSCTEVYNPPMYKIQNPSFLGIRSKWYMDHELLLSDPVIRVDLQNWDSTALGIKDITCS